MITKSGLRKEFGTRTKKIEVKAWGGEVEIKRLSIAENNEAQSVLLKDMAVSDVQGGQVEVSIGQSQASAVISVAYALVNPRMTAEELGSLDSDGMEGVTEIKTALDEWDTPKKSQEESSDSD
ncbi:MAG: hypothetical protein ABXS91_10005 [Sulfurimonas sp.]